MNEFIELLGLMETPDKLPLPATPQSPGVSCVRSGIDLVRRWVLKFGPMIARKRPQRRPRPSDRWHLDEMVVRIAGNRMYLWRAVDHEGEVLDMLVQRRRDGSAALRLASCSGNRVSRRNCWLPTSWALTDRRSGTFA